MMTGLIQDQNLEKQIEKQIGCMSGFLHIFDRQQILAGKRVYSTKRLPPSIVSSSASPESVKSVQSTASRELKKEMTVPVPEEPVVTVDESPDRFQRSPAANSNAFPTSTPPRSPLPLPIFELKEGSMKSSWKFCKEMPRLSLDSRATVDSKGSLRPREIRRDTGINSGDESFDKQRRSPSVIARLMGLEQLPSSDSSSPETVKTPELRRSASESRVSRDLFNSRFIDCNNANNIQAKQANQTNKHPVETDRISTNSVRDNMMETMKYSTRNQKNDSTKTSQWRSTHQRRCFFDSADIFPEPKQTSAPVYGDYEKGMKIRGIDEQSKDLETLKHILEALQFKGLLHSNRPVHRDGQRNFVYDQSLLSDGSNIVLMKPWRLPAPNRRFGNDFGGNRYSGEISPSVSPRKDRGVLDRSGRSPVRARNSPPSNLKNGNTIVKRKPLIIETERRFHESSESRRNSPINSPKLTAKRSGSDYNSITNRSPRSKRPTEIVYSNQKITRNILTEDESSSFSESSGSTTSQSDRERSKTEENRDGKSLLARCDKLLHSIAEMNSITESHTSFNSVIPSPVSVLDSTFDKDESSSPSPVMKRSIDFKDLTVDLEDDIWRSIISPATSTKDEEFRSDDSDFIYISEILQASKYFSDDSTAFFFLEKYRYLTGNDSLKGSKIRRKLVFDVVGEITNRNRELPPWKSISLTDSTSSIKQICTEFQKIREPDISENLDLSGNNGWGDQPVEVSEAVLYIERLIFKDLVSETIRDLAEFAGKTTFFAPRRKLVF
ncbi:hypothetical protein R6Q59_027033 [Mikania micrantha]